MMRVSTTQELNIVNKLRNSGCVFAQEEARLLIGASRTLGELNEKVDSRVDGLPLEHILEWTEFCGLRIVVEPGVFIPRRRTEFLVQQAISLAESSDNVVVDLCCGSGAVGVAFVSAVVGSQLYSVDIEPSAVRCARLNAAGLGQVFQGDLFTPLPSEIQGRVNILMANAPYVPTQEIEMMPRESRLHEPMVALDGGEDGCDVQRLVVAQAPLWLAPGGNLIIETSKQQSTKVAAMCSNKGLIPRIVRSDELDATVVIATKRTI